MNLLASEYKETREKVARRGQKIVWSVTLVKYIKFLKLINLYYPRYDSKFLYLEDNFMTSLF